MTELLIDANEEQSVQHPILGAARLHYSLREYPEKLFRILEKAGAVVTYPDGGCGILTFRVIKAELATLGRSLAIKAELAAHGRGLDAKAERERLDSCIYGQQIPVPPRSFPQDSNIVRLFGQTLGECQVVMGADTLPITLRLLARIIRTRDNGWSQTYEITLPKDAIRRFVIGPKGDNDRKSAGRFEDRLRTVLGAIMTNVQRGTPGITARKVVNREMLLDFISKSGVSVDVPDLPVDKEWDRYVLGWIGIDSERRSLVKVLKLWMSEPLLPGSMATIFADLREAMNYDFSNARMHHWKLNKETKKSTVKRTLTIIPFSILANIFLGRGNVGRIPRALMRLHDELVEARASAGLDANRCVAFIARTGRVGPDDAFRTRVLNEIANVFQTRETFFAASQSTRLASRAARGDFPVDVHELRLEI